MRSTPNCKDLSYGMHVVWPSEEKKVEEMEEGKVVYYIDEGRIYSVHFTDIKKTQKKIK